MEPGCPAHPCPSLLLLRPPSSEPILLSLQIGSLWSWSAWQASSSSSSWASAGASAVPTPAAATSDAPAVQTSAAALRPVSTPHLLPVLELCGHISLPSRSGDRGRVSSRPCRTWYSSIGHVLQLLTLSLRLPLWCWELKRGPCACWANTTTELLPQL